MVVLLIDYLIKDCVDILLFSLCLVYLLYSRNVSELIEWFVPN